MLIAIIIVSSILFLGLMYVLLGMYISSQVNFIRTRRPNELYRNEWKENIPHKLINPPHKKLYIKSRLGYELAARFFPAKKKTHKYMLLMHGYNNCSITCGKYAMIFNSRGYNCIAPDSRRCGDSKGRGITFGYYERSDAEQWVEEIYKMDPDAEIGLFGISLGAATSILLASMRNDIKFVISYCSFCSFKDIILDKGSTLYPRLIKIFYPAIVIGGFLLTGARLDLIDISSSIKNVDCPTLILHSKADAFTPFRHALKLKEMKLDAELRSFERSPHARAYSTETELYTEYLNEFIDKIDKQN